MTVYLHGRHDTGFTESSSEGAALGCIGLAVSDGFDFTKWKRMGE